MNQDAFSISSNELEDRFLHFFFVSLTYKNCYVGLNQTVLHNEG